MQKIFVVRRRPHVRKKYATLAAGEMDVDSAALAAGENKLEFAPKIMRGRLPQIVVVVCTLQVQ